jgi:hypothetical protein
MNTLVDREQDGDIWVTIAGRHAVDHQVCLNNEGIPLAHIM